MEHTKYAGGVRGIQMLILGSHSRIKKPLIRRETADGTAGEFKCCGIHCSQSAVFPSKYPGKIPDLSP